MNWLCRHPSSAFLVQMPIARGGYVFRCDLRDAIAREVCFTGCYEPQETALVQALLKPGMTFVDVGANWGYFTLIGAHLVGAYGRVISLEPEPRLFKLLSENLTRNALHQVTALQVAAADKPGMLTLEGYDERDGNFGVSRIVGNFPEVKHALPVMAQTLDDLFDQLGLRAIDLLKMDIEGAEGLALTGLGRSLAERRAKRLLLELHPSRLAEHGNSCSEVLDRLRDAGYRVWVVDHSHASSRRAAYTARLDPRSLLYPLEQVTGLDDWPHVLCTAPGLEPLP